MSINTRLDLRHLRSFVAVAELLHFKKAADSLFITQPALSRLIKALEEDIGAKLFTRTTRQVFLTEAGRLFLEECRYVFNHIDRGIQLAQHAAKGDIGHISIAYNDFSINGTLPGILETFKEKFPQISVDLTYMPSHVQHQALQDCSIDIGFLIGPYKEDYIESLLIHREKTVAILPVKHPMASRQSIRLKDLFDEKFIVGSESGWKSYRSHIFTICRKSGFIPQITQEASTSNGIFGLVAANMGISLYAECVKNFTRRDIVVVPLEEQNTRIETVAAWNKAYESASLQKFVQHLNQVTTT